MKISSNNNKSPGTFSMKVEVLYKPDSKAFSSSSVTSTVESRVQWHFASARVQPASARLTLAYSSMDTVRKAECGLAGWFIKAAEWQTCRCEEALLMWADWQQQEARELLTPVAALKFITA